MIMVNILKKLLSKYFRSAVPLMAVLCCFSSCANKASVNGGFLGEKLVDDNKLSISQQKEFSIPETPAKKGVVSFQEKLLQNAEKDEQFNKKEKYAGDDIDEDLEISIDFDEATIGDVLDTFSELIGMNLILGPNIQGKITVKTHKKFKLNNAFKILHSILEVNGLTTVKSGDFYKVVPISQAKQYPIEMYIGKSPNKLDDIERIITQIIPLENIPVGDIVKVIQPLISKGGSIITHKDTNILILNDLSSNIKRLMRIINLLDVPSEMSDESRVYVYYVRNKKATELSTTLNSIYKKKKRKKNLPIKSRTSTARKGKGARTNRTVVSSSPSLSEIEGEVSFVADKEINALIIKTTPRIYPAVLRVIGKLDIMPRQVLIEVLIADITLNDNLDLGTTLGQRKVGVRSNKDAIQLLGLGGKSGTVSDLVGGAISAGLSYAIGEKDEFLAMVTALANKGKAKVLASPHLVTTDNKAASVSFGEQIPISTSTLPQSSTGGAVTQQITTSVQYKDVSTKLEVTPNINQNGQVSMEVNQEISELGTCDRSNFNQCPINKRSLKTTVVVQSGKTLVLGGLIKETKTKNQTGVPFLMDIPIIGRLFSSSSWSLNRSEVVLLITPHVISNKTDVDVITESFKKRVDRFLGTKYKRGERQIIEKLEKIVPSD